MGYGGGGRGSHSGGDSIAIGILYQSINCHHQNDSCIKMAATRGIFIFH